MMTHSLYPEFQSAYLKNHSTETALVRVMNDILMKMNTQEVTLLVMLDLGVTFDKVSHNILLTRLNEELGICPGGGGVLPYETDGDAHRKF